MRERVHVTWSRIDLADMSADQIRFAKAKLKEAWEAELPPEAVYRHTGLSPEDIEQIKLKDPAFAELEIESYGSLNRKSRINVARSITEDCDVASSWKYLEKTDPQFMKKPDQEKQRVIVTVAEREEALKAIMDEFDPGEISFDITPPVKKDDSATTAEPTPTPTPEGE